MEGMSVRLGPVRAGVLPIMVLKPWLQPGGQMVRSCQMFSQSP